MKRTAVGLSLIAVLAGLAFGQSIKIAAPKAGDAWLINSAKTITWTSNGMPASTKVRIVLWKDGVKLGEIAAGVPIGSGGAGSWAWAKAGTYIGGTAASGPGYQIRIRDSNNQYPVAKSDIFSLTSLSVISNQLRQQRPVISDMALANLLSTIAVSTPAQGSAFKPGEALWINWSTSGITDHAQVALDVYLPDKTTKVGSVGTSPSSLRDNTGKFEAYIFNDRYEWGKDYVIRVATPDEKHIGWSGIFHITPLQPVPETETFTGSHTIARKSTGESGWIGCLNALGEGTNWPPTGYDAVGWENSFDDPTGPCWAYVGNAYRTVLDPDHIYKGWEVTKAVLHFAVTQGQKQTFSVWKRTAPGDEFATPAEFVANIGDWGFGGDIAVDVTAQIQAWCTGQAPYYGFVIVGGDESFSHNNVKARCIITKPQLVITKINYQ